MTKPGVVKKSSWEFSSKDVTSNFLRSYDPKVPQKTLRDDETGLTITCVPVRTIFEPSIPYDNCCELTVTFDNKFPNPLLELLNFSGACYHKFYLPENGNQTSQIFFMDGDGNKALGIILNTIQRYLILDLRVTKEKQPKMLEGLDKFRKFALLAKATNYLPVHSNQFFSGHLKNQHHNKTNNKPDSISDESMANSAFGQASHTAKRTNYHR